MFEPAKQVLITGNTGTPQRVLRSIPCSQHHLQLGAVPLQGHFPTGAVHTTLLISIQKHGFTDQYFLGNVFNFFSYKLNLYTLLNFLFPPPYIWLCFAHHSLFFRFPQLPQFQSHLPILNIYTSSPAHSISASYPSSFSLRTDYFENVWIHELIWEWGHYWEKLYNPFPSNGEHFSRVPSLCHSKEQDIKWVITPKSPI